MKVEKLTKEVDWFCLHMVQSGLMSKEECVAILDALEANDDVLSNSGVEQIDIFIQVMQDNQLGGDDYEQIENIRRESKEESRSFGFPSHGLFMEERTKQNSAIAADVGNIDEARMG